MGKHQKKIFVVDDDSIIREMLCDKLRNNPSYEVTPFSTGEECMRNLHQSPDVVVLDFHLNNVYRDASNGLQILEQIKKFDKAIAVIMLSSQEKYGIALQTVSKGAEQYVVKDEEAFDKVAKLISQM